MYLTKEQSDRILREIMDRSQHDARFRELCLSDPRAAIKQVSGQDLAPAFTVRFVDNAGADLTLVLPDPEGFGVPLTDDELAGVKGGVVTGGTSSPAGPKPSTGIVIQNIRLKEG